MVGKGYDEIFLGIPNKNNGKYKSVLEKFDIHMGKRMTLSKHGIPFYKITSPAMRQDGYLGCFGEYGTEAFVENEPETRTAEWVALMRSLREKMMDDAAYWLEVIRCLADEMDEVWLLCKSHVPDYIGWPLVETSLDELQAEHLLKLYGDHAIVIRKRE